MTISMGGMNSKSPFFFYFNNTKENKDNKNLKMANTFMKFNLPQQIDVMTFERIDSLNSKYLLRLHNTAEYDDLFVMNENEVVVDLTTVLNSLKLKVRCCVRVTTVDCGGSDSFRSEQEGGRGKGAVCMGRRGQPEDHGRAATLDRHQDHSLFPPPNPVFHSKCVKPSC